MKVVVIGYAVNYTNWLNNVELIPEDEYFNADLALFTGGEDVSPELYGETYHESTGVNKYRDEKEVKMYNKLQEAGIPCLGICRGSQFLTALQENGRLIQDVKNHAMWGQHELINLIDGIPKEITEGLTITSTHHQMMYPFDVPNHIILAISPFRSRDYYMLNNDVNVKEIPCEPEIVYYQNTKCLCIQGHPEMMKQPNKTIDYCNILVEKILLNK